MDAVCNRPRTDAICINQLKNAKPIDKGLLQERPDVKIFLPFRFLFYRPEELFQAHQYNRYLGMSHDHVEATLWIDSRNKVIGYALTPAMCFF